jgi:uncharacterized membrane protein
MPGWHPLVVHFPIALLSVSSIVDLVALLARRPSWHTTAYALLVAGTVAAAAAVISGNSAAAPHRETEVIGELVARHEDSGSLVLALYLVVTLGRLPLQLRAATSGWRLKLWCVAGAAGCVMLWRASSLGGSLVFDYGVGVTGGTAEVAGDTRRPPAD